MQRIALPLVAGLLLVATACACNIPVFRYALERWRPDVYEIHVDHGDRLSQSQKSKLAKLEQATESIRVVVNNSTESSTPGEPQAVVRCNVGGEKPLDVWQGKLDQLSDLHLSHSPARTKLQQRLLKGDAVVWLMIESKDDDKNKSAKTRLGKRFDFLAKKIELPEGIGLPGSELFSDVPLLLQFSILEIDRQDSDEQFLLTLFRKINPAAFDSDQPIFVPVFGRGRALEIIPADELTDHLIDDLSVFLSGACSCQVKERNPGFDLLLSADWDRELFGSDGEAPADAPLHQQNPQQPQLLTIPPGRKK